MLDQLKRLWATPDSARAAIGSTDSLPNEVVITDEWIAEVADCVSNRRSTPRVLFDQEMQFIRVAGTSQFQPALKRLREVDGDRWHSGFIGPEPTNAVDPEAVAVYLIGGSPKDAVQVGYLQAEVAHEVFEDVNTLLRDQRAIVPVLAEFTGGTRDKPTIGLRARIMSQAIFIPEH